MTYRLKSEDITTLLITKATNLIDLVSMDGADIEDPQLAEEALNIGKEISALSNLLKVQANQKNSGEVDK